LAAALVAICAAAKAAGTLGGWVLVTAETTRWTAAAGYLPRVLAKRSPRGASVRALLVMAVVMTVVVFLTASPTIGKQFGMLIGLSVILSLMVYAYCCVALWRLSDGVAPRRRRTMRVVAVLAIGFCLWTAFESGTQALTFAAVLLVVTFAAWPLVRRAAPGNPG
jgi:arginine:agmatine antiporter